MQIVSSWVVPLTGVCSALQIAIVLSLLVGAAGYLVQVRALALLRIVLTALARVYD